MIVISELDDATTNDLNIRNRRTKLYSMEGYGPHSMIIVDEPVEQISEDGETKYHPNNEGCLKFKSLFDDSCKNKIYNGSTGNVATKCTQTPVERRMCYRCALVIQDVKVAQEDKDIDPLYETHRKDTKVDFNFSNDMRTPTEVPNNQLELLAQEVGVPSKSPSLSSFSISRHTSNYSIAENSGYKEIFKEIFLILHNAHNA